MTYMNLDRGLTPSDVGDPYDGDKEEKNLSDTAKYYTPQQVFGEDVFEKPSIDFFKWQYSKGWNYFLNQWFHNNWDKPATDEEVYQEYLKSTGK